MIQHKMMVLKQGGSMFNNVFFVKQIPQSDAFANDANDEALEERDESDESASVSSATGVDAVDRSACRRNRAAACATHSAISAY